MPFERVARGKINTAVDLCIKGKVLGTIPTQEQSHSRNYYVFRIPDPTIQTIHLHLQLCWVGGPDQRYQRLVENIYVFSESSEKNAITTSNPFFWS